MKFFIIDCNYDSLYCFKFKILMGYRIWNFQSGFIKDVIIQGEGLKIDIFRGPFKNKRLMTKGKGRRWSKTSKN